MHKIARPKDNGQESSNLAAFYGVELNQHLEISRWTQSDIAPVFYPENIFYFEPVHTILGTRTIFRVYAQLHPPQMLPLPPLQDNSSKILVHEEDWLART